MKPANQVIRDIVLEELAPLIILATPAPHVLSVAVLSTLIENAGANAPHDDAEDEKGNGKRCVVDGHLFGSFMATTPPSVEYTDGHDKRNAGDDEDSDLRPYGRVLGPRRQIVSRRDSLGRVEDGKGGCHHRKHDQTAAKVDATKEDLGHSHSNLGFL